MRMKVLILLTASLVPLQAMADRKPDTVAILKQARMTGVFKIEDLTTGTISYRIEFCADEDCDRFEADAGKLRMLADYAYLFAVYDGGYNKYYVYPPAGSKRLGAEEFPNPMVTDAKEKGYAQAVLDSYRVRYHCPEGSEERKCVMHELFEHTGVRRYSVKNDEGESYSPVDEDNKPLYRPPS